MIGYYVHHHGAGHVSRATAICHEVTALGHEVTGLSTLPRPQGWQGAWVDLADDAVPAEGNHQDPTAGGTLHWAPLDHDAYRSRMGALARWLLEHRPEVLVVDVSAEVTLLARLLGVPAVVVAMRGQRDDPAHCACYGAATRLLAPWPADCPEPWWPTAWLDKTDHVGALTRFDSAPAPEAPGWAAGPGQHGLVLWGRGGGTGPDPARLAAAMPGWKWYKPSGTGDEVWRELHAACVVICHAGQNAVAEVAAARRPAVVVAEPRPFDEQLHTARALEAAGLAVCCERSPDHEQWPALVEQALALGGQGWAHWHDGFGARRAAAAICDVARAHPGQPDAQEGR
ncbi:glycosyltransferase [Luteococcus sp. H138]|uniref:glycosyltransferase n=1 Tax=unclassified Luteococcus TaxID=2639923 RepID=UPI00313E723B